MKQLLKFLPLMFIFVVIVTVSGGLSFANNVEAQGNPALPTLGTARNFGVLAGSTATNTGNTVITGNLGVSPGAGANNITGFPPGIVTGTTYDGGAVPLQAQNDVTAAYVDLAGRSCDTDLTGTDLGGLTLTRGVYCFSSGAGLTGALTLDAEGDPDAVFIFQIGESFTTGTDSSVSMINSGGDCNVFWQIGQSATLGTSTDFVGNILALTSITLVTNTDISGRALARNGAVTMDTNDISIVECADPTSVSLSSFSSSPVMENIGPWLLLVLSFLGITWWVLRIRRPSSIS